MENNQILVQSDSKTSHQKNISQNNFSLDSSSILQPKNQSQFPLSIQEICSQEADYLAQIIGLNQLPSTTSQLMQPTSHKIKKRKPRLKNKIPKQNTKNVLKNMGYAQNMYILSNPKAKKKLEQYMELNLPDFFEWVRNLKLDNFLQFRQIWMGKSLYEQIYKKLCWNFYVNESVAYVFNSKMRQNYKNIHLRYIFRFLQGILDPSLFYYFKDM